MHAGPDEALRLAALRSLGVSAPVLAREALEAGIVEVEPNVLGWTGSHGDVRAHRAVLALEPELHARVAASPFAVDALTAALAAGISATSGDTLAELKLVSRAGIRARRTAYRGGV